MMKRRTRNHVGLQWEDQNLNNDFVDINRVALDDAYGKVGAPLSKRRNGNGPAGRDAQAGLFGVKRQDDDFMTVTDPTQNPRYKAKTLVQNIAIAMMNPKNIILAVTIASAIVYYRKR